MLALKPFVGPDHNSKTHTNNHQVLLLSMFVYLSCVLALVFIRGPPAEARGQDSDKMTYEYIPDLLRMNRRGESISSDLSDYVTYSCRYKSDGSDAKTCSADVGQDDFRDALSQGGTDPADDSIVNYLEGVAMYGFINMAGLVLLVVLVALYLIYYLFSLCCPCGKAHPTKTPPMWRFYLTYGCMLVTLLFLSTVAILGHTLGGSQLTQGIVTSSDSAAGVTDLIRRSSHPAQQLIVNTLSAVIVPALAALNSTVFSAIDVRRICEDAAVVDDLYGELNIVPFVRRTFDDLSRRGTAIVGETEMELGGIIGSLRSLDAQAHGVLRQIEGANDSLVNMTGALQAAVPTLGHVNLESKRIMGPSAETGENGLRGSILSDLSTISRNETAPGGFGFPLAATFSDAISGSVPTLDSLQPSGANSLDGSSADILDLNVKLAFIHDRMNMLPNYTETGIKLVTLNSTLRGLLADGGSMDQLVDAIRLIEHYQSFLPNATHISNDVAALFDTVYDLSFDELRELIGEVGMYMDDLLEPFRLIQSKLKGINITSLVAPLHHLMVVQAEVVSKELFNLNGLYNSTNDYLPLQRQIEKSSGTLDDVVDALVDAIDSIKLVNVTEQLKTVNSIANSINETIRKIDEKELQRAMSNVSDVSLNVNATSYIADLLQVRSNMENVFIPNSDVLLPALNLLEAEKSFTVIALRRAIGTDITVSTVTGTRDGDYVLLAAGVCSENSDVYCSSDSDCAGNCQHRGVYRCAGNGMNAPVIVCSSDNDCGSNSYCLNDNARTAALRLRLEAFAVDTLLDETTDRTSLIRGLSELEIQTVFNISSALDTVETSLSDLQDINLQQYIDQTKDVIDQFGTELLSDINQTITDASEAIEDFDFTKYNSTLKDVEKVVAKLDEYFPDVVITCNNVYDFIHHSDGMKSHFEFFSELNLLQLVDERGPGGMLSAVFSRVDQIGGVFRDMFVNYTTLDRLHFAEDGADYTNLFNKVSGHPNSGYGDIYQHGSIYFLTQLYNETKRRTISANNPIARSVYEGRDGKVYDQEDQKYICSDLGKALFNEECFQLCLTRDCFIETKSDLDEEPIVESSNIDTSFQAVVGYVWIMPFIAVFFGVITLLTPLLTAKPWVRKLPASCMLFCIICQLGPFLLLSGFFFPFVILAADTCSASDSLVQGLVQAYGNDICKDINGTGGLHSCTLNTYNFSVTVDPYGIVSGVVGDCSAGSNGDPYQTPLRQIADQLRYHARDQAHRKLHGEYYTKLEIDRLNKNLEDIGLDSVANTADVAATFLEDFADDVLSCSNVADIRGDLIYPVCTSTIGALGWYLGCIYLMAWSLCCLGIPAGCCVEYENEQRAKAYLAYEKAFGSPGEGGEDIENRPSDGSEDEPGLATSEKHKIVPLDDDDEAGGAYGAVFGPPRTVLEEGASAPPPTYYNDGDYEMVSAKDDEERL